MIDTPFQRYRSPISADWVDYNGHMNVAYYTLAFDRGTDVLFDALGIGQNYLDLTQCSLFALEAHIVYEREMRLGQTLSIRSTLLAADRKRLHIFHEMFHAEEQWRAATLEGMSIHIDMARRRSTQFPPEIEAVLAETIRSHNTLPRPRGIGRQISMPT